MKKKKKKEEFKDETNVGGRRPDRNATERFEIEQTSIENRREADLDDKTPAGDAGVEDNKDEGQAQDPIGESNY